MSTFVRSFALCAIVLFCSPLYLPQNQYSSDKAAAEDGLQKLMWRPPREATIQDWVCGFSGCDHAPAPPFRFVKEDLEGTSSKLSVNDAHGRSFSVKFGSKAVPESFASRFVTAVGYVLEPSYYVGRDKLENASRLHRARGFVKADGTFTHARFQLRDDKELEFLKGHAWSLGDNPFRGSHEFAGSASVDDAVIELGCEGCARRPGRSEYKRFPSGECRRAWTTAVQFL